MLPKRLAGVAASCILLAACGGESSHSARTAETKQVKLAAVQVDQASSAERVPGNVRPAVDVTIEAKISGRISKLLVKEGDLVKSGQLLVEIDAKEIQAKLDQALASKRQAEQDLERFAKLLPSGAVTKQEYDTAVARANVTKAGVEEASAVLAYAHIEAPFDGVVTKKSANEGDLALPGKPLLSLEKQELYRFEADVPETLSAGVTSGKSLQVRLAGVEEELAGSVAEISPTTDPSSRTLHVKLDLPSNPLLRSGQFGYVLVPVRGRAEMRIPLAALVERGQMELVFVERDGAAELRLVRSGKRDAHTVEILSGLSAGDKIVTSDPARLHEGDKLEVMG